MLETYPPHAPIAATRGDSMNPDPIESPPCPCVAVIVPLRFDIGHGLDSSALVAGGESSDGGGEAYDFVGEAAAS